MNKNIIIVGAIAAGLYLFSQEKKAVKAVVKKKAPRRPPHIYNKPKIKRVIARKKSVYHKPKPRIAAWKKPIYRKPKPRIAAWKKPIYRKPKTRVAVWKKKPTYYKPKPRVAAWKKQIIKRMARRKR